MGSFTYDVAARHLDLQTSLGLVEEDTRLRSKAAKPWENVAADKFTVAIFNGLQREVLRLNDAVHELITAVIKSLGLLPNAEKKTYLPQIELFLIKSRETSPHRAMAAVNKKLSASPVQCGALGWNRYDAFSKLKMLETDLEKSLTALFERATKGSSMM